LVDDESKNNIILEEVSRGYKLYDLVLRPARVKIGVYRSNK
jgi:molecular chaperone GrpE (heat shock protein)